MNIAGTSENSEHENRRLYISPSHFSNYFHFDCNRQLILSIGQHDRVRWFRKNADEQLNDVWHKFDQEETLLLELHSYSKPTNLKLPNGSIANLQDETLVDIIGNKYYIRRSMWLYKTRKLRSWQPFTPEQSRILESTSIQNSKFEFTFDNVVYNIDLEARTMVPVSPEHPTLGIKRGCKIYSGTNHLALNKAFALSGDKWELSILELLQKIQAKVHIGSSGWGRDSTPQTQVSETDTQLQALNQELKNINLENSLDPEAKKQEFEESNVHLKTEPTDPPSPKNDTALDKTTLSINLNPEIQLELSQSDIIEEHSEPLTSDKRLTTTEFLDLLKLYSSNSSKIEKSVWLYQPALRAPQTLYDRLHLSTNNVHFPVCFPDLIELRKPGELLEVRIVDAKATDKVKLYHRVQLGIYYLIIDSMLEFYNLKNSVYVSPYSGIWLRDQPEYTEVNIIPIVNSLEQFFLGGFWNQLIKQKPLDIPYQLSSRCIDCSFETMCLFEATSKKNEPSLILRISKNSKSDLIQFLKRKHHYGASTDPIPELETIHQHLKKYETSQQSILVGHDDEVTIHKTVPDLVEKSSSRSSRTPQKQPPNRSIDESLVSTPKNTLLQSKNKSIDSPSTPAGFRPVSLTSQITSDISTVSESNDDSNSNTGLSRSVWISMKRIESYLLGKPILLNQSSRYISYWWDDIPLIFNILMDKPCGHIGSWSLCAKIPNSQPKISQDLTSSLLSYISSCEEIQRTSTSDSESEGEMKTDKGHTENGRFVFKFSPTWVLVTSGLSEHVPSNHEKVSQLENDLIEILFRFLNVLSSPVVADPYFKPSDENSSSSSPTTIPLVPLKSRMYTFGKDEVENLRQIIFSKAQKCQKRLSIFDPTQISTLPIQDKASFIYSSIFIDSTSIALTNIPSNYKKLEAPYVVSLKPIINTIFALPLSFDCDFDEISETLEQFVNLNIESIMKEIEEDEGESKSDLEKSFEVLSIEPTLQSESKNLEKVTTNLVEDVHEQSQEQSIEQVQEDSKEERKFSLSNRHLLSFWYNVNNSKRRHLESYEKLMQIHKAFSGKTFKIFQLLMNIRKTVQILCCSTDIKPNYILCGESYRFSWNSLLPIYHQGLKIMSFLLNFERYSEVSTMMDMRLNLLNQHEHLGENVIVLKYQSHTGTVTASGRRGTKLRVTFSYDHIGESFKSLLQNSSEETSFVSFQIAMNVDYSLKSALTQDDMRWAHSGPIRSTSYDTPGNTPNGYELLDKYPLQLTVSDTCSMDFENKLIVLELGLPFPTSKNIVYYLFPKSKDFLTSLYIDVIESLDKRIVFLDSLKSLVNQISINSQTIASQINQQEIPSNQGVNKSGNEEKEFYEFLKWLEKLASPLTYTANNLPPEVSYKISVKHKPFFRQLFENFIDFSFEDEDPEAAINKKNVPSFARPTNTMVHLDPKQFILLNKTIEWCLSSESTLNDSGTAIPRYLLEQPLEWGIQNSTLSLQNNEQYTAQFNQFITFIEQLASIEGKLTKIQLENMKKIIKRNLSCLWGPPGTGKTHFLSLFIISLLASYQLDIEKPTKTSKAKKSTRSKKSTSIEVIPDEKVDTEIKEQKETTTDSPSGVRRSSRLKTSKNIQISDSPEPPSRRTTRSSKNKSSSSPSTSLKNTQEIDIPVGESETSVDIKNDEIFISEQPPLLDISSRSDIMSTIGLVSNEKLNPDIEIKANQQVEIQEEKSILPPTQPPQYIAPIPLKIVIVAATHSCVDTILSRVIQQWSILTTHATLPLAFNRTIKIGRIIDDPKKSIFYTTKGKFPFLPECLDKQEILQDFIFRNDWFVVGSTVPGLRKFASRHTLFDIMIIDEASQMSLPHTLIAVQFLKKDGQLIFAGDDKQLGPIIKANYPSQDTSLISKMIYAKSVFEYVRFFDPKEQLLEILSENWRSCLILSALVSESIYHTHDPNRVYKPGSQSISSQKFWMTSENDKLWWTDQRLNSTLPIPIVHPLLRASFDSSLPFIIVMLRNNSIEDAEALVENEFRHDEIIALLTSAFYKASKYINPELTTSEFWKSKLLVVTPHHVQRFKVLEYLKTPTTTSSQAPFATSWLENERMSIDTVEKAQGQEFESVILDYGFGNTTRVSREVSFIFSRNRMNVGVTRAKKKCIMFVSDTSLELRADIFKDDNSENGFSFLHHLVRHASKNNSLFEIPISNIQKQVELIKSDPFWEYINKN